jgi:hypothetical protein
MEMTITTLFTTAAFTLALLGQAQAGDTVPAKFQGTWVSTESKSDTPITIGANSISLKPNSKCNITSVMPGNEELTAIIITWKCPETPAMRPVEMVLKLTKVNGQEMLLQTNTECPACWLAIFRRVK